MLKEVSSKVDFPTLEREIITYWNKNRILEKYLKKNQNSRKRFSFIDGPITANNPMGVHHAWGRTYKDLWQRFFNMKGAAQRFQNGFDEQGLWVEVEVEKELGLKTKKDIENLVPGNVFESIAKFVDQCKERVKKFSKIQTSQSERLGYFMDWDNSYHTSSDENNYAIWHYLKTINSKGWLYKGRDSVPWCPRCGTAISQHEILTEEYKEVVHKAVYFKLPITSGKLKGKNLLVWTTTPWTIPGNIAVAVNPKKTYVVTEDDLIVMKETVRKLGLKAKQTVPGEQLIDSSYEGPFDNLEVIKETVGGYHLVVDGEDLVDEGEGTGLVHIAPGAGEEDFKLSQKYDLVVLELIDEEANYLKGLGFLSGQNAKNNPDLILDHLKKHEKGKFFFKQENYKHRYPVCWRCKTELVWRVVDEWYIAMDRNDPTYGKTYRELMKQVIKKINWIPSWGYDRELDWLKNMHDWLISKKRYWGLALPIWECSACGNFDVIGSKEELEERSVSGWEEFSSHSPHRPWIDKVKIKCSNCGAVISRIADVGNPWLDAGIVPFSTLKYFSDKEYWKKWYPADFITESFPGQFKNWFYSLIAMATALENNAPFRTLLGHGSVRDEKGEEMHKSKGNAIWFDEAAEKMGVDVMRWLYLRTNPEQNVNFGYRVADEIRRFFHLRLWNVYAFFVNYAALDKWKKMKGDFLPEVPIDKWILSRLSETLLEMEKSLEAFDSTDATSLAESFIVNDFSNWYVRLIRDRVGPTAPSGKDKNDAYQTLWIVLTNSAKALAPFIPFVTEEIYRNLTGKESVHLENWPKTTYLVDNELNEDMSRAMILASQIHSLRKAKNIKVRQPLKSATYGGKKLPKDIEDLIAQEVNVKELIHEQKLKQGVSLDTEITEQLLAEGEAREIIRQIQEARKELGCRLDETISVELISWPQQFSELIKSKTLSKELKKGKGLKIVR